MIANDSLSTLIGGLLLSRLHLQLGTSDQTKKPDPTKGRVWCIRGATLIRRQARYAPNSLIDRHGSGYRLDAPGLGNGTLTGQAYNHIRGFSWRLPGPFGHRASTGLSPLPGSLHLRLTAY